MFEEMRKDLKNNNKTLHEIERDTSFHGRISLRDIPRHGSQQRDPMFRGRNRIRRRRIHHQTPVLRRRRQIHVVDPHAGASHHL